MTDDPLRARPHHAADPRAQAEDLMKNAGRLLAQAGELLAGAEGGDPVFESSPDTGSSIRPGMPVVDNAGEPLGEIMTVRADCIVVEAGALLPTDSYVPHDAIAAVEGEMVRLRVDKAALPRMRWEHGVLDGPAAPDDAV